MRKILAVIVYMSFALVASAQALPSLLIGADPQAAATGGSSIARVADAYAVDNNSAAMALSDKEFSVAASYGMWAPNTADNMLAGLGFFYRLNDRMAVGFTGRMLRDKPYDITSVTGQVSGSFAPSDLLAGVGFSYAISDGLSLGVSGRFTSSSIAEGMKGTAIGADITALYSRNSFSAAAGLCNLGTPISYGAGTYAQPMLVKAGAAYSASGLTASAEVDYLFSGALMAGLGVEYCIADIASLRAGYHYGDPAKALASYASLGLGLEFSGFSLDLAFLTASETLGNSLLFGIGYSF